MHTFHLHETIREVVIVQQNLMLVSVTKNNYSNSICIVLNNTRKNILHVNT